MSTEMTSPSSELKPMLMSNSPESSGAAFSPFSNDQDSTDFAYEPRSSGLPSEAAAAQQQQQLQAEPPQPDQHQQLEAEPSQPDQQQQEQQEQIQSTLCSVDVARQSRDMVDDMLEEMAADPAKTVDMVLDYNRSDGPTLGWGDEEEQKTSSPTVPASPKGFTSSLCAIKNGRKTMEDRHIIIHDLNKALGLKCAKQYSYYAIFDGHAGVDAATYSTAHLHHNLVGSAAFAEGRIEDAFKEAFEITDSLYVKRTKEDGVDQLKASGTTALCALIEDQKTVYLAWVGDSQAVLVRNGSHEEIMLPHKPEMDSERTRIQDLGGLVVFVDTWRVNGILSVTRAIGDPDHKPYINAEPSLAKFTIDSSLDFLVLGCDGLFDQLTGQDIASHVFEYLCKNEQKEPQEVISGVSTYLSQMAIREGSTDNITSIVLFFKPFEQLVATGYPVEGEVAEVTMLEADKTSVKTPLESADFPSMAVNSLPTATNGGHFPYTDFSELPVGTNFNLHSMPPADAAEEDDVKEDKEDATASVMKNPFEGYDDSGFDFNGGASAAATNAAVDDYDATAGALATEQAALDFETTDAMDDFTFTASATTDIATTVAPPVVESTFNESDFLSDKSPAEDFLPVESVPMNTTPVASTPVETSAPPLTDWSQDFQPQQSAPAVEVQESASPFAFDDQKITEDYTALAVQPTTKAPSDDWSQFEAPPVIGTAQTQEPEYVQEDIFKVETVETTVPAVPTDDWSQFEATQSMPVEQTMQPMAESDVHEDNLTTFDLKQSEEQESTVSATLASESSASHTVEETEDTEKTSAPIDSTFGMETFVAVSSDSVATPIFDNEQIDEPDKMEPINSSTPFDTEHFLAEPKEETVNPPEPIDSLVAAVESLTISSHDATETVAESNTETVSSSALIDIEEPKVVEETANIPESDMVESVSSSTPFDTERFLAEQVEETFKPSEPIDNLPVAVDSFSTSLEVTETIAESKTEAASAPAPVDIEPKVEEPKVEEPKVEEPKVEEPKVEEPKVEEPKVEEPKVEEPKVEEPKVEEAKIEEPKIEESKAVEETANIPEPVAESASEPPKPKATTTALGIKKPLANAGKVSTLISKAKPSTATSKVATKTTAAPKTTTEVKPGAIKRTVGTNLTAARSTVPKPATSSTAATKPGLAKPSTTALAASRPTTRSSPSATTAVSKVGSTRVGVTAAKTSASPKTTTTSSTARTTSAAPRAPITRVAPKTTTQPSTAAKTTADAKPGAIKRTVASSTVTTARSTTAAAPKPATARVGLTKTTSPIPTTSRLASARPTPPPGTSRLGTTSRLASTKPIPKAGVTASAAASKTAVPKTTAVNGTSNGIKAVPKKPATGVSSAKVGTGSVPKPPSTSTVPAHTNGSVKSYSAKRPMGVENSLKQELEDAVNGLNNGTVQQQQQQSPPPVANGEEMNGINGHNGL